MTHVRCRGDGWIRVGAARGGGRRGRGRFGRTLVKARNNTVAAGGLTVGGYAFFGVAGAVVVVVLVALVAFLAVQRAISQGAG